MSNFTVVSAEILGVLLYAVTIAFFFLAACSDPGIIPRNGTLDFYPNDAYEHVPPLALNGKSEAEHQSPHPTQGELLCIATVDYNEGHVQTSDLPMNSEVQQLQQRRPHHSNRKTNIQAVGSGSALDFGEAHYEREDEEHDGFLQQKFCGMASTANVSCPCTANRVAETCQIVRPIRSSHCKYCCKCSESTLRLRSLPDSFV